MSTDSYIHLVYFKLHLDYRLSLQYHIKMNEPENSTTNLLVEIPRDLEEIIKEILTCDFKNGEMACWILGRRKIVEKTEIITFYELVIPPPVKNNLNESKLKIKDIVGTIISSKNYIPMEVEKKLTEQKHIRMTIDPMSRNIETVQVEIKEYHNQRFYKQTQKVITQIINLDTILTDCRPLTENFKDSGSSLGDPFKPKPILRQLSASTYTRLSKEQVAKIHIGENESAKEHFEKVNLKTSKHTL